MKNKTKQSGLTIIEILVVVAVIAILVTITVGITSRVDTAIKERKTRAAIDLLATALEKYYQFHKDFPLADIRADIDEDYGFDGYITSDLGSITGGTHDPNGASSELIYYCMNKTPLSKDILNKIDSSLVVNKDTSGNKLTITVNSRGYDLFRVNDSWKMPLRYTYDKQNDSFPLIESAGPDKVFGDGAGPGDGQDESYSEDNIKNR